MRVPVLLGSLAASFAIVACSVTPEQSGASSSADTQGLTPHVPQAADSCGGDTPVAGKLTLYLIPPGRDLDWSSPTKLLSTTISSEISGATLKSLGLVAINHEIGHVNLSLDCGDDSIPLTGQTGGDGELDSAGDGFGMLLRSFDGSMNEFMNDAHQGVVDDIALRQKNGYLAQMSFLVNAATCKRVKTFHDEYIARGAYKRYGGDFRSRRFEGGGCAIWGADVVDVSGMLRRSQFAPIWTQSMMVGHARYSNSQGGVDHYDSGSNLVWRGPDGNSVIWPHGLPVPSSTSFIFPGTSVLETWTGPEDTSFANASLKGLMDTQVPFSIFDPMLMNHWAEKVWADANSSPTHTATSLEATWTSSLVGKAHEITTDAHCTQPQAIPFDQDNDDLFKDSDQPN